MDKQISQFRQNRRDLVDQVLAVLGKLDSPALLLDQLPIVVTLKRRNSLTHRGLRDAKLGTCLHHGAGTCKRQQGFQILNHVFNPGALIPQVH